jgi:hypothetical protein
MRGMALMLFAAVVLFGAMGAAGFVTGRNFHAAQAAEPPAPPDGMQVPLLRD